MTSHLELPSIESIFQNWVSQIVLGNTHIEMSKVRNNSFVLGHFSTDELYRTGVG